MNNPVLPCGGALGAVLRYGVSLGVYSITGRDFPYGTLVVNVSGSLFMGILSIILIERFNLDPEWRAAILIGLLGSLKLFSFRRKIPQQPEDRATYPADSKNVFRPISRNL